MIGKPQILSRIAALLLLLVPLLAACSTGSAPPQTTQPTAATSGGAATAPAGDGAATAPAATSAPAASPAPSGNVADVTVTMPYPAGDSVSSFDHAYWTSQLLISQGTIFEGLFGYDKNLNVIPKVAESATPSADNKVWTIKLRKDKKWSNGDPVTARDYYVAWVRFLSPELADTPMWAGFQQYVTNAWAFKGGAVKADKLGIKLVDDYTLEVTLIQPNSVLPNFLVLSASMPINEKSLKEHPTDWWDPKNAVYNGPYIVKEWVSGGDILLERNPNYVGEGIGNVAKIALKPFPDANARLQAFENGDIQFTFLEDASQVQYAQSNPTFSKNIHEELSLNWDGVQYNRAAQDGPLADERVRKAFAMAIDKQAITSQILRDLAVPTGAFSGDPEIAGQVKPLPFDVAAAKKLLADAGYPDGKGFPELIFYAPPANAPDMPVIEAIVKMWQDNLGVTVTIQNNEQAVYNTLQWTGVNTSIKPGFTMMSGPLNWFEPGALLEASDHIWYFMDMKSAWKLKRADFDRQITDAPNTTKVGDFADLEKRANVAWATRQKIIAAEGNSSWAKVMQIPPSFIENFTEVKKRFEEAKTEEEKLAAYKDALLQVLREEQDTQQYDNLTDSNKQAQRLLADLRQSTMKEAKPIATKLQQLAADTAWMVPIYVRKRIYVTDSHLSGIVLNKLSWGGNFQLQYLQWTP
jgi:peptide/nickel transport system substrate-binding protein